MFLLSVLLGAVVGSYLGCIIYRLPKDKNTTKGRSKCVKCGRELDWKDLFPIFSFLILAGRCRYCGTNIWRGYIIVELITVVVFVAISSFNDFNFLFIVYGWFVASVLILIGGIDLIHLIIPDRLILTGFTISFFGLLTNFFGVLNGCERFSCSWIGSIGGGLLFGGIFAVLFFASSGKWIGFGDVKLGLWLGFAFGLPSSINIFYLTFILGALTAIVMLVTKRANRKTKLPLGFFMAIASIVYIIFPINFIPKIL